MAQPNIVFIIAHDLGRHLGCYGVPTVQTPHLDRLAADGVRFSRSFCVAPQCSPSRAALFTGRTPHQNGVMGLTHSHFAWDLHEGEQHLAGLLKSAGYDTALVGIQHETNRPQDMGWNTIVARDAPPPTGETTRTGAHAIAGNAVQALNWLAGGDAPFYLQVGFFEPHRVPGTPGEFGTMPPDDAKGVSVPPFLVNDGAAQSEFRHYQGAIRKLDYAVGEIFAAIDALPGMVRGNTLVVFTTDHGMPFPRAKCSVYEPGMETCLLLRWPEGGLTGGKVIDALVPHTDVFATLCEWGGVANTPQNEGQSFAPLLRGDAYTPHEAIFGEMTFHDYTDPVRSVRTDDWKLIANFSNARSFMDPSQQWQPRCTPTVPARPQTAYHPPIELYDLKADPNETVNLANDPAFGAIRAEMTARLFAWMQRTDDPLLSGIPLSPIHRATLAALKGQHL